MNFPGFSSVQGSNGLGGDWNPRVNPTPGGSEDATFAEVALGLIESPAAAAAPAANATPLNSAPANSSLVNNTTVNNGTAAPLAAAPLVIAVASATSADPKVATTPSAYVPVTLTQSLTDSIFSGVLTPAQYLNNVMARIQTGSPVGGDTPMTVTQALQQAFGDYSTPQSPYAECSDPSAAAALVAQIAGPNANLMVSTAAKMTFPPAAPTGWVGDYTLAYATQSTGFNDATETFAS